MMGSGNKPPYAAGLLCAWFADEAESSAGLLTRWRDMVGGGHDRDWVPGAGAQAPTKVAAASGNHSVLRCDGVDDYAAIPVFPVGALSAGELFIAFKSNQAPGVANGLWNGWGTSGVNVYQPFSDDHFYDDCLYTKRPDIGLLGPTARAGLILDVRVSGANYTARANATPVAAVATGVFGIGSLPTFGRNQAAYGMGDFAGMLLYGAPIPTTALQDTVARWMDRRCGMAIGI